MMAHRAFCEGEVRAQMLEDRMWQELRGEPEVMVEYIAIVEPEALEPVTTANARTIIAIAARVGGTRLIDNMILAQGLG
jgi:pantothenate synthetase